jgi:hypothetical protein
MSDIDDIEIEGWPTPKPASAVSRLFPLGLAQLVPKPRTKNYNLVEDFECVTADGQRDYIKAGFETDGASIPWIAWLLVGHPYDPNYVCESVIHDDRWRKARTWAERTAANHRCRQVLREHGAASRWDRFSLATGVWFGKLGNALAVWR